MTRNDYTPINYPKHQVPLQASPYKVEGILVSNKSSQEQSAAVTSEGKSEPVKSLEEFRREIDDKVSSIQVDGEFNRNEISNLEFRLFLLTELLVKKGIISKQERESLIGQVDEHMGKLVNAQAQDVNIQQTGQDEEQGIESIDLP